MKWSYRTYLSQPTWFISGISEKLNLDAAFQNQEAKRNKYGRR